MFNLLRAPCFPVRRKDGQIESIGIWQLGERDNPPIDFVAPRPDLRAAMLEFTIGLFQTIIPPENDKKWADRYLKPPSPTALQQALEPYTPHFELFGEGPRFMQDLNLNEKDGKAAGIGDLLIDSPGGNTLKNNIDHFIKRGRIERLSSFWTAMSLFCLQIMAPSGGKGHRTGLRGGGPLTTLFRRKTLWQTLWSAVINRKTLLGDDDFDWEGAGPKDFFPWTMPTIISDGKSIVSHSENHPVMVYWAMPRRIRLSPPETGQFICDLSGESVETVFTGYVTKAYGNNYGEGWIHPLSPHYMDGDIQRPVHGQPGGVGYQHWIGLLLQSTEKKTKRLPARAIEAFTQDRRERIDAEEEFPLLMVFGYDMDNAKCRSWIEAEMPVNLVENQNQADLYAERVEQCIEVARYVLGQLRTQYKNATHREGIKPRGSFDFLNTAFWNGTREGFLDTTSALAVNPENDQPLHAWLRYLQESVMAIFEHFMKIRRYDENDPEKLWFAQDNLAKFTAPNGKKIRQFFGWAPIEKTKI